MRTRLDVPPGVYSCLGLGLLLYALSAIEDAGGASVLDLGSFLAGLLVVVLFCRRQLYLESPLVNLPVFTNSVFSLTRLLSNIAMDGMHLVLPCNLQNARRSSAPTSGLVMLPGTIIIGIFKSFSGLIYQRIGARKILLFRIHAAFGLHLAEDMVRRHYQSYCDCPLLCLASGRSGAGHDDHFRRGHQRLAAGSSRPMAMWLPQLSARWADRWARPQP